MIMSTPSYLIAASFLILTIFCSGGYFLALVLAACQVFPPSVAISLSYEIALSPNAPWGPLQHAVCIDDATIGEDLASGIDLDAGGRASLRLPDGSDMPGDADFGVFSD